MFEDIYYNQKFRTFLHYAYFPTLAVTSFVFVSWFLQVDTGVESFDNPVEITSTQSVSESSKDSEKLPATAQKVKGQAIEAQRKREISECGMRNERAMKKYAESNTAKNWGDWAAIDKWCRSLRGE
jgi:hypothetical protein